jgi:hypothetical protein
MLTTFMIPVLTSFCTCRQGRPLGGASGAFAPGADFEGVPRRRSTTSHTLIRSTVAWWFPHLQTERVAKDFFFNLVVLALAYSDVFWWLHMFFHVMLHVYFCKYWHQDIKMPMYPLLFNKLIAVTILQSFAIFFCIFLCRGGGAPTVRFAPVVPWAKASPACRSPYHPKFNCISYCSPLPLTLFVYYFSLFDLFLLCSSPVC